VLKKFHQEAVYHWKSLPDNSRMVLEGETPGYPGLVLQLNRAIDLMTPEFATCLSMWNAWNAHNALPYSGGKWEQPAQVSEILDLFDGIYARWSS